MISTRTFYRGALALPLVLPWIAVPMGWWVGGWMAWVSHVLVLSLLVGGVPYLLALPLLWQRIGRARTPAGQRRVVYTAPLICAPLMGVAWVLVYGLSEGWGPVDVPVASRLGELAMSLATVSAYVLVLGYGYAMLTQALFHLARRSGWIRDDVMADGAHVSRETGPGISSGAHGG